MAFVRAAQNGPYALESQRILNELAEAQACLLDPVAKARYDETLRQILTVPTSPLASRRWTSLPPVSATPDVAPPRIPEPDGQAQEVLPVIRTPSRIRRPRRHLPLMLASMAIAGALFAGIVVAISKTVRFPAEWYEDAVVTAEAPAGGVDARSESPAGQPESSYVRDTESMKEGGGSPSPSTPPLPDRSAPPNVIPTPVLPNAPPDAPTPEVTDGLQPMPEPAGANDDSPRDAPNGSREPRAVPNNGISPPPSETDGQLLPAVTDGEPGVDKRYPLPGGASLEKARAAVNELFGMELADATTPAQRAQLIKRLLGVAKETKDDTAGRYSLLLKAQELAMEDGDPELLLACIKEVEEGYQVDGLELRSAKLTELFGRQLSRVDTRALTAVAEGVVLEAVGQDRYEVANRLAEAALAGARRKNDSVAISGAKRLAQRTGQLAREFAAIKDALAKLELDPSDVDANLRVGEFYCFHARSWNRGLKHLAESSSVEFSGVAQLDIAQPTNVDEQVTLGDAWRDRAKGKAETVRGACLSRAAYWYEKAVPSLSGLTKSLIEKRAAALRSEVERSSQGAPADEDARATIREGIPGRMGRRRNALRLGATVESELAVENALDWLTRHQNQDGSWSFDHRDGKCNGACKDQGSFRDAKNAATGLALLAFLGAGESHLEGDFQDSVAKGLGFLLASQKPEGIGGASWYEKVGNATNYSHALATTAVCEAYAITGGQKAGKLPPTRLREAAQHALDYLAAAQHGDGGWRYQPKQAGDMSVSGLAFIALKTGSTAKLKTYGSTNVAFARFLASVQDGSSGHIFHYLPEKNRPADATHATTALGTLCRMYSGAKRGDAGISKGIETIGSKWGPEIGITNGTNMYFNYYATQAVFHFGGESWEAWNQKMRDYLVTTQEKDKKAHAFGSWYFNADHGSKSGGRLYITALSALTLEVYYRYPPIYSVAAD